jgi:hypothetical protein
LQNQHGHEDDEGGIRRASAFEKVERLADAMIGFTPAPLDGAECPLSSMQAVAMIQQLHPDGSCEV